MKKIIITTFVFLALFTIAGISSVSACDMCHVFPRVPVVYNPIPTPTPAPTPSCAINSFTINGSSSDDVDSGDSVRLSWTTNGYCTSGSISNFGNVNNIQSGSQYTYPEDDTTYTLYAYGQYGSDTRTVRAYVQNRNYDVTPSVTTYNPSAVGTNSATISGYSSISSGYENAWLEFPCYSTQHGNRYSVSSTNLSAGVYNLSPNTRYSYCAAAQNTNGGQTVRGNIVYFTTAGITQNTENYTIRTKNATGVTKTNADINGTINNPNNYSLNGYFEYGTTVGLGSRTSSKTLGSASSINFSDNISGLSEDTIYYYRAVSEGSNGTQKGLIEIFATPGTVKAKTVVKNTTQNTINTVKRYKTVYVPMQVEDTTPLEQPPIEQIDNNNQQASAFWSGIWLQYGPIFWLLLIIIILLIVILARTYTKKTTTTTVTNHDNHIH